MVKSLFDPLPPFLSGELQGEASAKVAFAGNTLDRQSENRPPDCLTRALAAGPPTFLFAGGRLILREHAGPVLSLADAAFTGEEVSRFRLDEPNAVLLGYDGAGTAIVAMPVLDAHDQLPAGFSALAPRAVYIEGLFDREALGAIAQGSALVSWALSSQFCGVCGTRTVADAGGYRRRCDPQTGGCGNTLFPRTDPVVIMLAVDETHDKCLLGRSPHFPTGFYSCLAGFLEPGETMEDAVRRETLEEAGITVGAVRYHASQPWPMPHTMMVGFYGEALSSDIDLDGEELEDCRWFSREEARRLLERRPDELTTAPDGTIANRLLRDWIASG